jgi:hypothetical protein
MSLLFLLVAFLVRGFCFFVVFSVFYSRFLVTAVA